MLSLAPLSGAPLSSLGGPIPPYVPPPAPPPGAIAPSPNYDLLAVYDSDAPGYVFARGDMDALYAAWAGNGFYPLTPAQVLAAVASVDGPQPPPLTSIRRLGGMYDAAPCIMTPSPTDDIVGEAG